MNMRIEDEFGALSQARTGNQRLERLRAQITPELGARASQLITDHASLSGQLLNDILMVAPYNQAADDLAEMDDGDDGSGGLLGFGKQALGFVADQAKDGLGLFNENVVKPTLRTVNLVADSSFHELSRGIMATGALRQIGIGGGERPQETLGRFSEFGDSPLTNIVQGQESFSDQGTGYFFNGGALDRSEQENTLEIEGQTGNFGRYVASNVVGEMFNPGDMVYDLTAGVSEFAGAVVLDPLAWGTGGLAKGAKAGRQFSRHFDDLKTVDDFRNVTRVDKMKSRIGMIDTPKQRTIVAERTRDWLNSTDVYDELAKADEYEVFQRWARSPAKRANVEISRVLGGTKNADEAREAVEGLIRKGLVDERGFFDGPGAFIRKHTLESDNLISKRLRIALDPDSRLAKLNVLTAEGRADKRFAGLAPEGFITADDLDTAAFKLDSMMRQGNVGRERRAQVFTKMAGVDRGDEGQLVQVWTDSMKAVEESILDTMGRGIGKGPDKYARGVLDELTTKWDEETHRIQQAFGRVYAFDDVGSKVNASYARKTKLTGWDGDEIDFVYPHPTATAELGSMRLALPDPAHIRRAAEKGHLARTVYTKKGWGTAETLVNGFTNVLFKPAVLLRPAFMVREFLEAQMSLTAGRFRNTALNHPVDWFAQAWHLGEDGWREVFDPGFIRRTAKEADVSTTRQFGRGVKERFARVSSREDWTDLVGEGWADVARKENMLVSNAQGQVDLGGQSAQVVARNFDLTPFDTPARENLVFWTKEMGRLRASPEYVKMAEFNGNVDAWMDWATNSKAGQGYMDDLLAPTLKRADVPRADALEELGGIVHDRLRQITGGFDDELFEAFKSGNIPMPEKLVNGRLQKANWDNWDEPTQAFMAKLRAKFNEGTHPRYLKAEKVEEGRAQFNSQMLDNLKDVIFNWAPSKFTRYGPFKESYVNRTAELMDMAASDELRDEILEAAVKAWKLTPDVKEDEAYRALLGARNQARGLSGEIDNLDDYNDFVKAKAVDDVTQTVFDVSNRGAAQDTFASFVPFLDAWKEMMTRWPRLIKDNPGFFIRGMSGVREMQNQGVFYTNVYGETVFRYPGSQALVKAITTLQGGRAAGAFGVALEGRVAGLNIATDSIGPGLGPVVQMSAGFFKDPDLDTVREMIAPFGVDVDSTGDLLDPSTYTDMLMPAWFSKALTGFGDEESNRQFNSTAAQLLDAYAMSGDYDLNDPDSVAQMVQDSERAASIVLFTRAMYQAGGPTGPGAQVEVPVEGKTITEDWDPESDPDGKWFTINQLASDYHRLAEIHGWDVAAEKWFDMYGKDPYFIAQATSTSGGRELPVTKVGDDWMRRNEAVVDKYEHVAGYFAPTDEEDNFDFTAYNRQFLQGKRETLSAEQQAKLALSTRARAVWRTVQERTENLDPFKREQVRREIRDKLEASAPNWRNPGIITTLPAAEKMRQLEAASLDPMLADNPLTRPLRAYFEAREIALSQVREVTGRPNATLAGQAAAPLREELRMIGRDLRAQYPEFAGVWSSLLLNEIEEDD